MSQDQNKDQEKTEEPTQRKIEKAREEGNVSRSVEISSVMLMIIATVVIYNFGVYMYERIQVMFRVFLSQASGNIDNQDQAMVFLEEALILGFQIIIPILIVLVITAILVNVAQTGVVFSTKVLEFKPNRMNPVNGFKRIFSMRGLVELAKGLTKIFIVGLVIYFTVRNDIANFISLPVMPIHYIIGQTGYYILLVVVRILAALLILAAIDAAYQRFQHRKDLRMTKQEVKDEYKQMEGDPQVKSYRKKLAMKFLRQKRLDHAVLASDVIVTNPTHYAVALKYDPNHDDAPRILAKGMRNRALKIREYAKHYDIPIMENPPLARSLHAAADEDELVPPTLYQAVAEVLAYVYRLKNKKAA